VNAAIVNVGRNRARHIGVNAEAIPEPLHTHFSVMTAPIAPSPQISCIQALHQHDPSTRNVGRVPAGGGWLLKTRKRIDGITKSKASDALRTMCVDW